MAGIKSSFNDYTEIANLLAYVAHTEASVLHLGLLQNHLKTPQGTFNG